MQKDFAHAVGRTLRNPRSLTPLVLVMGFIGASLRYLLEALLPAGGGFPAATLIVNISGCFMLEIINQYVALRTKLPAPLVRSMGIGLIGAYTTIAALSTENLAFLQAGRYGMFALYLGMTVVTTFLSAWVGKMVADKLGRMSGRTGREGEAGEGAGSVLAGEGGADPGIGGVPAGVVAGNRSGGSRPGPAGESPGGDRPGSAAGKGGSR